MIQWLRSNCFVLLTKKTPTTPTGIWLRTITHAALVGLLHFHGFSRRRQRVGHFWAVPHDVVRYRPYLLDESITPIDWNSMSWLKMFISLPSISIGAPVLSFSGG